MKYAIAIAALVVTTGCRLEVTTNGLVYESPNFAGLGYYKQNQEGLTKFGTSGDVFKEQPDEERDQ